MAAVHDRARGHRGLAPAGPALQGQDLAPEPPVPVVPALRAGEARSPAALQQPLGAGGLVREPALERRQRRGKIRHGAIPPIPLQDWIAWRAQRDKPFPEFPVFRAVLHYYQLVHCIVSSLTASLLEEYSSRHCGV